MNRRILLTSVLSVIGTAASAGRTVIKRIPIYRGPAITQVLVNKSERRMYLLSGDRVVKKYRVNLGFDPDGHKTERGDGRTPEGLYWIDRSNLNSRYYLSLGISYPNAQDVARAEEAGVDPGGDIFIHGGPRYKGERGKDWTAGCISVSDRQMKWVFAMVKVGTPIYINP
ncbi:MAG: L,D-transpeptidase family protein [Pseudomonadota bacterium]